MLIPICSLVMTIISIIITLKVSGKSNKPYAPPILIFISFDDVSKINRCLPSNDEYDKEETP
jgi:hypothetical protein